MNAIYMNKKTTSCKDVCDKSLQNIHLIFFFQTWTSVCLLHVVMEDYVRIFRVPITVCAPQGGREPSVAKVSAERREWISIQY